MVKKFEFPELLVKRLQKVEDQKEGGEVVKYKAQLVSRGKDADFKVNIESSEPINVIQGDGIKVIGEQVQLTLDDVAEE